MTCLKNLLQVLLVHRLLPGVAPRPMPRQISEEELRDKFSVCPPLLSPPPPPAPHTHLPKIESIIHCTHWHLFRLMITSSSSPPFPVPECKWVGNRVVAGDHLPVHYA